jgi:hypothetical protein
MKLEDNLAKNIDDKSIILKRVKHKRLPLLYYEINFDANPFSLDLGYLWVEGKKIYEERLGSYKLEDSNERYFRN